MVPFSAVSGNSSSNSTATPLDAKGAVDALGRGAATTTPTAAMKSIVLVLNINIEIGEHVGRKELTLWPAISQNVSDSHDLARRIFYRTR